MKSKRLFQVFLLLALLFSPFGANQPVQAGTVSVDKLGVPIIDVYSLDSQNKLQLQSTISIFVSPSSMNIGELTTVTVNLNNVPAEGYTSAEFTCTYDPNLMEASNIVLSNLFGSDPVVAIHGPQDGQFVVAIAGSQGNKATISGKVIAFNLRGLQASQSQVACQARVSTGSNALTWIGSTSASFTIIGNTPTPTIVPLLCDKAEFIADITVPPGTVMSPGAHFTKTWRLKNIGSCTWTSSYRLAFLSGEQMGAVSSAQFPRGVAPGMTVDISLNMTAPSTPDDYRGYWIFQNDTGGLFGIGPLGNQPWFVDIVVSNATVTPPPTLTVSPSPTGTQPSGTPADTPTPSPTLGGSTVTPIPGIVYDFAINACQAVWFSGAGQLPCPGVDGNPNGFVFGVNNPKLENGAIDTRPGLLTFPQNVENGYIQGFYPPFHVQSGDRFRSLLACEFEATNCYVAFRLDYQVGSDPVRTFWGPFLERYEGVYYTADIDLSSLAGKDVKFILTVLSAGVASGDRALWVGPIIYRTSPVSMPTLDVSQTPTSTPLDGTGTPMPAVGLLNGKVFSSKLVRIEAYDTANNVVGAGWTNSDGSFEFHALSGTNTVVAMASGFLSAQRSVIVTDGSTTTLPTISLIPGDLDNNNVIDQYDAMTIGMNYNTALPAAADLNNDGIINVLDLELLAKNYRRTGPVPWNDYD